MSRSLPLPFSTHFCDTSFIVERDRELTLHAARVADLARFAEEPASGMTFSALPLYLARRAALGAAHLLVVQGVGMSRASEFRVTPRAPHRAAAGRSAQKIMAGELDPR